MTKHESTPKTAPNTHKYARLYYALYPPLRCHFGTFITMPRPYRPITTIHYQALLTTYATTVVTESRHPIELWLGQLDITWLEPGFAVGVSCNDDGSTKHYLFGCLPSEPLILPPDDDRLALNLVLSKQPS